MTSLRVPKANESETLSSPSSDSSTLFELIATNSLAPGNEHFSDNKGEVDNKSENDGK